MKPRFLLFHSGAESGTRLKTFSMPVLQLGRSGSERRVRQRRQEHDAAHALGRELRIAHHERLDRDATHRVADEDRVVEVEAP